MHASAHRDGVLGADGSRGELTGPGGTAKLVPPARPRGPQVHATQGMRLNRRDDLHVSTVQMLFGCFGASPAIAVWSPSRMTPTPPP